jgi:hypothetical protein
MSAWAGVGTQCVYEFVDGSSAICTFVGWESLNLILRQVDGGTGFPNSRD